MSKTLYAQSRIQHGTEDGETLIFEAGEVVKGVDDESLEILTENGTVGPNKPVVVAPVEEVEEEDDEESTDYSKMTVAELRDELEDRGFATDGNKGELIERLEADDEEE